MDDKSVCRLCLNLIVDENCETLEDMQKGMLAVIVPEFNLDLVCSPNIICNKCSKFLLESYEFKSACIENSWKQKCESNEENIDESDTPQKRLASTEQDVATRNNCCLCLGKIVEFVGTENCLLNMKLKKCLPELEICPTSRVCNTCQSLLDTLFTFITGCLYAETKITGFVTLKNGDVNGEINLYEIYEHYSFKTCENYDTDEDELLSRTDNVDSVGCESKPGNSRQEFGFREKGSKFSVKVEHREKGSGSHIENDNPNETEVPEMDTACDESNFALPEEENDMQSPNKTRTELLAQMTDTSTSNVDGESMHVCKKCNFKTKHKFSMRRHYLVHKNIPGMQIASCEMCSFKTRRKQALNEHMTTHVESSQVKIGKTEDVPSVAVESPLYTCKKCPFNTKYKQNLSWHMLTHKYQSRVTPLLTCDECNFQTCYMRSLKAHQKKGHHKRA